MPNILGYGYVTVKQEDNLNPLRDIYFKNGASWAQVQQAYIKSGDQWIRVFPTPDAVILVDINNISFTYYTTFNSRTQPVTITNTGDEVLTITAATVNSTSKFDILLNFAGLGSQLPFTINPGVSKTFTVQLRGLDVGTAAGSIVFDTVKGVLGGETVTISIDGETLPLFSDAVANRSAIDLRYDQLAVEPTATVTVSNNGNGPLTISSIVSTAGFVRFVDTFVTVAPGKARTFTVALSELIYAESGQISDTIIINSDSVSGSISIPVTVLVVPHGSITFTTNGTWPVPFGIGNNVTVEMRGAAGGAGGNDSAPGGAAGAPGFYTVSAELVFGQSVEAYIGSTGTVGGTTPGAGGSPGGAGGANSVGYGNGAAGGRAGLHGWSGGGGGGGAASVALIKSGAETNATIFAGGGGGGGGGGNRSVGLPGNTGIAGIGLLRAVSLDGRWSSFMNSNAVWPIDGTLNEGYTIFRTFTPLVSDTYYFRFSADNSVTVYVDGSAIGSTTSFTSTTVVSRALTAGTAHVIRLDVSDWGVAAGVALTVTNSNDTIVYFNLRNVLTTVPAQYYRNGQTGQSKSGDGGGAGGGGGGYPAGRRGLVRGGDSGAFGGYRGSNGIDGTLVHTVQQDKTQAGSAYIKITW